MNDLKDFQTWKMENDVTCIGFHSHSGNLGHILRALLQIQWSYMGLDYEHNSRVLDPES